MNKTLDDVNRDINRELEYLKNDMDRRFNDIERALREVRDLLILHDQRFPRPKEKTSPFQR